ncbi:MAG: tRNA pseudouridine(13) synthase TruD [Caldilineaceae bacterium SB0668_bin_21]|nr:tRNA pseudouridine(13) synthase TruD [Caldilineaceae bacterium SB0668_bin_21]MYC24223.1 tRNA pseudouridine(13) synthase TruD [Caldilineaceae bacterium SB0662_bin_25]
MRGVGVELDLNLPYSTEGLPGVGGELRAAPDLFVVEEIPLYEASGTGQHLYVNVTKEELTTREVQRGLAEAFDLPYRAVGFAGMKDKYARATQTFSLLVGHVDESFLEAAPDRIGTKTPVTVNWVRLHRNKIKKGHLLGNRFTITITQPSVDGEIAMARAEAIAEQLRGCGLPNFYGPQRLGQNGSNVRRGWELLRGEKRIANRWLRSLLLASVQSYLCNRYLALRQQQGRFNRLLTGDIAKKHDTGGLFVVADQTVEQSRFERKEISFTAPIYGPKMWEAEAESGELEQAVLAESGLDLASLARAKMMGTRRLGRILLNDLSVTRKGTDIVVAFSLPKGAFATTVLREFMKVSDDLLAQAAVEDSSSDENGRN